MHQGDALAILPTLPAESADAVLTDPPYSSGGCSLSTKQNDPAKKYQRTNNVKAYPPMLGDAKDQRSFTYWSTLWLGECWRVARPGAALLVFTDWRQLPSMTDAIQAANWSWLGIIPWNKRTARPSLGRFRSQCEYVLFASKGRFQAATSACLPGLYDFPVVARHKHHLTGKPAALVEALLAIAPPAGTILDPFLGGGSTAVACLATGRRCIGIELSPEYAKISQTRAADFLANQPT